MALYAQDGVWSATEPFALQFVYLTSISGKELATTTIEEIRNSGYTNEAKLDTWAIELTQILPDVTNTTELTAVRNNASDTLFYQNDTLLGVIRDRAFSDQFFALWLGEHTSQPKLRRQLLGLVPSL